MSQNTALRTDKDDEIFATATLLQLSKRLKELALEPSTKRWTRNRAAAAESWAELRELAASRAAAAAKATTTKRAVVKPRTNVPIKTAPTNASEPATAATATA